MTPALLSLSLVTTISFIVLQGWMEKTALFYGWYPAKEINITSSNEYLMPFAYFMAVLGVLFFSLVRMARL